MLNNTQVAEMQRLKSYFPFRIITGVLLPNGEFSAMATATLAKPKNYARKNNGKVFQL